MTADGPTPAQGAESVRIMAADDDEMLRELAQIGMRLVRLVEANAEAQVRWAETVQEISKLTVFDKVKSWIQNDNIEGKKKYSAFFLGGLQTYDSKLSEEANAKYASFEFSS